MRRLQARYNLMKMRNQGFLELVFRTDKGEGLSFHFSQKYSDSFIFYENRLSDDHLDAFWEIDPLSLITHKNGICWSHPSTPTCTQLFDGNLYKVIVEESLKKTPLRNLASQIRALGYDPYLLLHFLLEIKLLRIKKEKESPLDIYWEPHEVFFHKQSREGMHMEPYGGFYPFVESHPSPLVFKTIPNEWEKISLPDPDPNLIKNDSLMENIQNRTSVREYNDESPSLKELSTLTSLAFSTSSGPRKYKIKTPTNGLQEFELAKRPYPSAGGLYDIETYILVHKSSELERGVYFYDQLHQNLFKCKINKSYFNEMIETYVPTAATQPQFMPPIIFNFTSRFTRIAWKYRSISYALSLKNLGVIYHQFYLLSEAMGLAPCALGGGDSSLFGKTCDIDPWEEPLIGEFTLGKRISHVNNF